MSVARGRFAEPEELSGLLRVRGHVVSLFDPPLFPADRPFSDHFGKWLRSLWWPYAPPVFHRLARPPVDNLTLRHSQISQAKILR
jgi:hypothetical protein